MSCVGEDKREREREMKDEKVSEEDRESYSAAGREVEMNQRG